MNSSPPRSFLLIFEALHRQEHYVPRPYQTIGGIWTRETYSKDDVIVYIEDEGYSQGIMADNLHVRFEAASGKMNYVKGNIKLLDEVCTKLLGT